MLLTDTIKNSTSAIKTRRATLESKQHAETYAKALNHLSQVTTSISKTLDCAVSMKQYGIVDEPLMDDDTKQDLLSCVNDCGNAISERNLAPDTVRLLQSKGDAISVQIKVIWKDASKKYSDGTRGYLSMIGGLSDNPQKARVLADSIEKAVNGEPSIKAITSLIDDVAEAKKITDSFALNTAIETFLQRVSSQKATVADLTPEIMVWLKEKNLMNKLRLRF